MFVRHGVSNLLESLPEKMLSIFVPTLWSLVNVGGGVGINGGWKF